METDIPLRVLTEISAADLLPLLGVQDAEVLAVESLEMPALATRLDNVLRLRDHTGNVSLHLVEWQGYRDTNFLWRVIGYLGWLGVHRTERPIDATPIYLWPEADAGDAVQRGSVSWSSAFRCIRLWQEDAVAAVRSGRPGLAVLSALMRGATTALMEEAAQLVANAGLEYQEQADLLSVLGVLGEALIMPERLEQVIGKERLMGSKLVEYLYKDKFDQMEQERQQERERERAARERAELERMAMMNTLVEAIEDVIASRFPTAPLTVATALRRVQNPERLRELLGLALHVPDLTTFESALEAKG
jgi:hypothetical protein